jgi:glycosyltransferase involved in cell wall biosynthesis
LPTGIDRVSLEYIRHYQDTSRAVLSLGPFNAVLSTRDSAAVFAAVGRSNSIFWLAWRVIIKAVWWRWLCLDVRGQYLFNTGHMGLENPRYAWALRRFGARPVFVISDLIPITHPEYCRPGERERHLTRIAAQLAPGLPEIAADSRPIARPYFVIIGTIEPRKNHWLLLQLWRQLVERLGNNAPRLVVIGQRGWECENVVDLLERCVQLKGVVIERPYCSDAELITWLHHARALLFPSFAEGYGMPLTEALAIGVPVIASELSVFRETSGDVPEYANPLDGPRWETLILDYMQPDSVLRGAQLERMRAFRPTTWPQHFARVDALLADLDANPDAKAA